MWSMAQHTRVHRRHERPLELLRGRRRSTFSFYDVFVELVHVDLVLHELPPVGGVDAGVDDLVDLIRCEPRTAADDVTVLPPELIWAENVTESLECIISPRGGLQSLGDPSANIRRIVSRFQELVDLLNAELSVQIFVEIFVAAAEARDAVARHDHQTLLLDRVAADDMN